MSLMLRVTSPSKNLKRSSIRRNVPRLYVQAIFALAAALALSTSACGKKDGGTGAVPAKTAVAPAVVNTSTIGSVAGTGGTPSSVPGELDTDSSKSSMDKVNGDEGGPLEEYFPSTGSASRGEPDPQAPKPSGPAAVEPLKVESVVYHDKHGMTPDQIFSRKADVETDGAFVGEHVRSDIVSSNGEALYYSGSSDDLLREELYTLVNENARTVDEKTRAGDKELAQTIQLSSFTVDHNLNRAELNFRFERMGPQGVIVPHNVTMQGPVDGLLRFKVGDLNSGPRMEAEVACMDNSGGCMTVHIKVKDFSTDCVRVAHMIARRTNATLYIEGNSPGVSKNAEYDRFMSLMLNTVYRPRGQNVVNHLTMTTSETIGGASNFSVTMKMRLMDQYGRTGSDTVEVSGPLAKPYGHSRMNVGLNVAPALTVINGEIVPTAAIGTQGRIIDTIRQGRLIQNDGRGNLQFDLTVRSAAIGAKEDRIRLTVARIHTPTGRSRLSMH